MSPLNHGAMSGPRRNPPRGRRAPSALGWWTFRENGRFSLLRQLTIGVGLLCLLTQCATVFHMLLVRHVRCAEHGEWLHIANERDPGEHTTDAHVNDDEGALPTAHSRSTNPLSGHALCTPSDADDDHRHDHCLISSTRQTVGLSSQPVTELAAATPSDDARPLHGQLLADAGNIYGLAPKTSPPL